MRARCSSAQSLELTPLDLVQIINLRPTTPVEAHVVRTAAALLRSRPRPPGPAHVCSFSIASNADP